MAIEHVLAETSDPRAEGLPRYFNALQDTFQCNGASHTRLCARKMDSREQRFKNVNESRMRRTSERLGTLSGGLSTGFSAGQRQRPGVTYKLQ